MARRRKTIHIARKGDSIGLRCWDLSFGALEEAPTKALSLDDWKKLQQALEAADFWSLSSARELPVGFDGAQWLIEGRRGDIYHAIHRWSPRGAVRDIGRLFFDLAGPPLATIDLS